MNEPLTDLELNPEVAEQSVQTMINSFIRLLPKMVLGIVVFAVFYFVAMGVRTLILRLMGKSGAAEALSRVAHLGILIAGLMVSLVVAFPSIDPASVLGALGFGGVAIGFAFRDILQNYFAGILLLWREPFQIGDQIETSNGFVGTIQAIETRATTMKTYDGRRVVIPNSDLFTDSVVVNTALENRRSQYDVGIGYGDDIETARSLMLEAINGIEHVLSDPAPDVLVVDIADSSIILRARWWTEPERGKVVRVMDEVITKVKYLLDDNGIDMPYPTSTLLFHDQTEETDGDRDKQREGWATPKGQKAPAPRYKVTDDSTKSAEPEDKELEDKELEDKELALA